MFRLSRYLHALNPQTVPPKRKTAPLNQMQGPVVIWNLIRRCNLTCKHCYATSADKDFAGELNNSEIFKVMDDLWDFGSRVLILSGGEPLMHPDIFKISQYAKDKGFYIGLSTNGTLVTKDNIQQIKAAKYDYVGISLDGLRATHDKFRRCQGAFEEALNGIKLCQDTGIKVGLRFTLTRDNATELPDLLDLMEREQIDKFYLSHLNYAGRGNKNRTSDLHYQMTREAMDLLFATCWTDVEQGNQREFVTGNNDADGVYLRYWIAQHHPQYLDQIEKMLIRWGGNASGEWISNIDNLGNVHPDTMWWDYNLGNVRDRPFSEIWMDTKDPLMKGLKQHPRPLQGRCAACQYFNICGGNSRTRAWQLTGNFWAEDPGCYLTDNEIGVTAMPEKIKVTAYSRSR